MDAVSTPAFGPVTLPRAQLITRLAYCNLVALHKMKSCDANARLPWPQMCLGAGLLVMPAYADEQRSLLLCNHHDAILLNLLW
jgi:hypothetical protein